LCREDKERATWKNLLERRAGAPFSASLWLHKTCFVTAANRKVIVGTINHLKPGECARIALPDGDELAVYNVGGEYYATENFCPHKGAPLSEGVMCGHVVECGWHGWQFDVRTGECLTVRETIKTYPLKIEDGVAIIESE
jgi:nitrite reductase/ring-hydroxylating ferredoxin subunit